MIKEIDGARESEKRKWVSGRKRGEMGVDHDEIDEIAKGSLKEKLGIIG